MEKLRKPANDEIEVSIFGGGNGYGECIVIHCGYNQWLVVDSTTKPGTNYPIALDYLNSYDEVVAEKDIKMIIASHWHDDHIKGIAKIIEKCPNATFVCSQALEKKQFFILLGQSDMVSSMNSGIKEFKTIFDLLKSRNQKITRAIQDRILMNSELPEGQKISVFSLSPSDNAIALFELQLKDLISELTPSQVVTPISPNHTSIVTVIQIGKTKICLGSDLENRKPQDNGWQAVTNAELTPGKTISVFKVPHHGSINAYYPPFWNKSMVQDPIAALTPYARGRKRLPSQEDIDNIYKHTSLAYITSSVRQGSMKKRDPKANKVIRSLGYDVKEIPFSYGHICLRKKIEKEDWTVTLLGHAKELKEEVST